MGILVNGINALAIIIGGCLGLLFKKKIKATNKQQLLKVVSLVIVVVGLNGALVSLNNHSINQTEVLLVTLLTLTLGCLIGGALQIDTRLNQFCSSISKRLKQEQLSKGFIEATLVFCVGAMAVLGPIQSGMGNYQTLIIKSILDGVTALILASSLGVGVILSSIPTFLYQFIFVLLGYAGANLDEKGPFLTTFNLVGYLIIIAIGINFQKEQEDSKIKVANLLVCLVLVALYFGGRFLFGI